MLFSSFCWRISEFMSRHQFRRKGFCNKCKMEEGGLRLRVHPRMNIFSGWIYELQVYFGNLLFILLNYFNISEMAMDSLFCELFQVRYRNSLYSLIG